MEKDETTKRAFQQAEDLTKRLIAELKKTEDASPYVLTQAYISLGCALVDTFSEQVPEVMEPFMQSVEKFVATLRRMQTNKN